MDETRQWDLPKDALEKQFITHRKLTNRRREWEKPMKKGKVMVEEEKRKNNKFSLELQENVKEVKTDERKHSRAMGIWIMWKFLECLKLFSRDLNILSHWHQLRVHRRSHVRFWLSRDACTTGGWLMSALYWSMRVTPMTYSNQLCPRARVWAV